MTDTRNANLTFAAGDVIGFLAPVGSSAPASFEDLASPYLCMGWLDTSGVTFKLNETQKDVMAAGTLDPIRTITSAATKTFDFTALEGINPVIRALYDDVDISLLEPGSGTVASYTLPEVPSNKEYCFVFDAIDGDRRLRSFAPLARVTTRGNEQQQQSDAEQIALTVTCYPALIGGVLTAVKRFIDYGAESDLTPFF